MFALSSVAFLWRSIVNDHTDDFQCFEDAVETLAWYTNKMFHGCCTSFLMRYVFGFFSFSSFCLDLPIWAFLWLDT